MAQDSSQSTSRGQKRPAPSTPTNNTKKTRGQTYKKDEIIAMIDCVVTYHTFNIKEKMLQKNPGFPSGRK